MPSDIRMLARAGREGGATTPQYLLGVGLSLLMLVLLANVIVAQYARGAVRLAADEGARAGARWQASEPERLAACTSAGEAVLDDLLAGTIGDTARIQCVTAGRGIDAEAKAAVAGWLPGVPAFDVRARAAERVEEAPQ